MCAAPWPLEERVKDTKLSLLPGPNEYVLPPAACPPAKPARGPGGSFGAAPRDALANPSYGPTARFGREGPGPVKYAHRGHTIAAAAAPPSNQVYQNADDDELGLHGEVEESWDPSVPEETVARLNETKGLYSTNTTVAAKAAKKADTAEGVIRRRIPHGFGTAPARPLSERVSMGAPGEHYGQRLQMEYVTRKGPASTRYTMGMAKRQGMADFLRTSGAQPNTIDTPGVGSYSLSAPVPPIVLSKKLEAIKGPGEMRENAKARHMRMMKQEAQVAKTSAPENFAPPEEGVKLQTTVPAKVVVERETADIKARIAESSQRSGGFLTSESREHFVVYMARNGVVANPHDAPPSTAYTPFKDSAVVQPSTNVRAVISVLSVDTTKKKKKPTRASSWSELSKSLGRPTATGFGTQSSRSLFYPRKKGFLGSTIRSALSTTAGSMSSRRPSSRPSSSPSVRTGGARGGSPARSRPSTGSYRRLAGSKSAPGSPLGRGRPSTAGTDGERWRIHHTQKLPEFMVKPPPGLPDVIVSSDSPTKAGKSAFRG